MNLETLDLLQPSDLRTEVTNRLREPERPIPEPPRTGKRVVAGVVALAVFASAAYVALRAFDLDPVPAPSNDPWGAFGEGWSELPAPPQWRDGAAIVWTGDELLSLGGTPRGVEEAEARAGGVAFDPRTGTWRSVPVAPWAFTNAHAVWTGTEAVVFGATDGDQEVAPLAFDPVAGTWRELPSPPLSPSWGGTSVWTGTELLVIGGGDQGSPSSAEGFALDPAAGTWRPLPPAPAGVNLAGSVWTGTEAVVVGSSVDGRNRAETRTSIAMAYSPASDSWRRLPDPPVSAQTADVAYVGGRLTAWELYSPAAAEYLPAEDRWRSLETGPMSGGECYAQGVTVGEALFSWNCGTPAAFFAATSAFTEVGSPPIGPEDPSLSYSWGSPIAAGPVALVEHIETVMQGGTPYVGAPDAPMHLWAWRPPTTPPPPTWVPTGADAENLVGEFLADWYPGWEVYLPTLATAEVIERNRTGADGLVALEGWAVRTWNSHPGVEVDPGVFEVKIELRRDGEVFATEIFTVSSGTTADGRESLVVIVDARPA